MKSIDNDFPYKTIDTNRKPTNNVSLKRSRNIEHSMANMVYNFWWHTLVQYSSEFRNSHAYNYWNKISNDVKNNKLEYNIYTSHENGLRKLPQHLQKSIASSSSENTNNNGTSVDINSKNIFTAGSSGKIYKHNKQLNTQKSEGNACEYNHITYGSNGFLYTSVGKPLESLWIDVPKYTLYDNNDYQPGLDGSKNQFDKYFDDIYEKKITGFWDYDIISFANNDTVRSNAPKDTPLIDKPSFIPSEHYDYN